MLGRYVLSDLHICQLFSYCRFIMIPLALDPSLAWLPGTLLGVTAGLWGTSLGMARGFGWHRLETWTARAYWLVLSAALVMFQFGVAALVQGRPYTQWFGWLLPGALGAVQLGCLFPVVRRSWLQRDTQPPVSEG